MTRRPTASGPEASGPNASSPNAAGAGTDAGTIRVGIGGWTFPPWRGTFYPPGLPHARELEHASRQVTTIEINGTFYGAQKPSSFAAWRDTAPDGFVFSLKASRYCTNRRDLGAAGESVERFLGGGMMELGPKLGPILWQFPHTRRFEPEFAAFLDLLPPARDGVPLRHVIEARHPTFADPAYVALLRERGIAHAVCDSDKHTLFGDRTAAFSYARLERNDDDMPDGYDAPALERWAARARAWVAGEGTDLPLVADPGPAVAGDCFVYFISGDKVRAPDAARSLLRRLGLQTPANVPSSGA